MKRNIYLSIFLLTISTLPGLYGKAPIYFGSVAHNLNQQDTLRGNQVLYNGQLWRNLYTRVRENQFLFSGEFLPGSVTINEETFNNVNIKYDIFNDELLTPKGNGAILQFNKEMVDSFSISFQGKSYKFAKVQEDSIKGFSGYVNVLNTGKNILYVKYKKEIDNLAIDDKYDLFFQTHRIYFIKDGVIFLISGKRYFLSLMDDNKAQIKGFIKKNRLNVSRKYPESFVPVVQFYNSLRQ